MVIVKPRLFPFLILSTTFLTTLSIVPRRNDEKLRQILRDLAVRKDPSPLDDEYLDSETPLDLNFEDMSTLAIVPNWNSLQGLPACQKECNRAFSEAMKVAFQAENNQVRFFGVCKNYEDGVACQNKLIDCPGRDLFDVMTSGLHFMCIEQRKAFERVINCIDAERVQVQAHCEKVCRGRNRLTNWAAQSGLLDIFGSYDKASPRFDGEQFRAVMQDVCDLSKCYLTCFRTDYNNKCGNSAGTLLSEAIVRPMAESQSEPLIQHMSGFMNLFMPHQCGFFLNKDELDPHRIDPHLSEALKRTADEEGGTNSNVSQNDTLENTDNVDPPKHDQNDGFEGPQTIDGTDLEDGFHDEVEETTKDLKPLKDQGQIEQEEKPQTTAKPAHEPEDDEHVEEKFTKDYLELLPED
ncbi:unnamed protein product [Bursaphelenchus xylophilus]|uniref:(pine wood nematode) hypothetical protein n=1 Tax=Bursaphelenchus xylophilus TaxID=6326 RepID=A0A1I7SV61_BURXY|nr:unnamed protein product [Bursaphelenchus xylophilus]CAG9100945.1 unnamed protein product [Bursaphelenchus xylophilus]